MKNKKTYWQGIEQLAKDPEYVKYAEKEFAQKLPVNGQNEESEGESSRRDFLKMMGFSIAAASLAACEAPVRKAIPYLNKPVDVDPGVPNYYASTFSINGDYCGIVVKTREGRPIKIEGNDLCPITKGGTSAQVQASVLSLYDKERLQTPMIAGKEASWEDVDAEVTSKLKSISSAGGSIRIVTSTILSPSTKKLLSEFAEQYPGTEIVTYDSQSAYGIIKANEDTFGRAVVPSYDFGKAEVVVGFSCDFLGTWLSPVEFTKQYQKNRKISSSNKKMSQHFQFESNLSLAGANADYRGTIKPSQHGLAVAALYNLIAGKSGAAQLSVPSVGDMSYLKESADALWKARGKSLVVSGSNDPAVQSVVNAINDLLGNYGKTIDLRDSVMYRQGDDAAMTQFVNDLKAGAVDAVVFYNTNPVYTHPKGAEIANAIGKAKLSVATNERRDETSSLVGVNAPDHHFLESWNDSQPKNSVVSLSQPAITPLFDTRQAQDSFLKWSGSNVDYFDYMKSNWRASHYKGNDNDIEFQIFWDKSLQDGVMTIPFATTMDMDVLSADFAAIAQSISSTYKANNSGIELELYYKIGIGDGTQSNNPWLQEMPDPISKSTWDNYLTVSQKYANDNGITAFEGKANKVTLSVGGQSVTLPVVIQPGQADGTVGLALGYGRTASGRVANNVGVDASPFQSIVNGGVSTSVMSGIGIEVLPEVYQVAQTQTHHTYMDRGFVIQESTLGEYKKDSYAGRYRPAISTWKEESHKAKPGALSLWKGHEYPNHHWGMSIDLNSCTGCSACTIACQSENNVPVVGREEVINRREMHWIRIDRYYSSDAEEGDNAGLEVASSNPDIVFQPVMCQHCNNAPCETVCPVAATTHSTEGLNQMTYNRCIGTRYCANNCPYKVRRFNWFKYHDNKQFADSNTAMNDDLGKMVLNPDVTVRSRGVIEKCSLCVQRIQYGKLEAKKENRKVKDGEINVACAQACPADAIIFGDMNDPNSKISKHLKIKAEEGDYGVDKQVEEERAYAMLEEIGVKPNVMYLTKIRNKDSQTA